MRIWYIYKFFKTMSVITSVGCVATLILFTGDILNGAISTIGLGHLLALFSYGSHILAPSPKTGQAGCHNDCSTPKQSFEHPGTGLNAVHTQTCLKTHEQFTSIYMSSFGFTAGRCNGMQSRCEMDGGLAPENPQQLLGL